MLASGLFGSPAGIISSDVALDAADPVVGSFTADGLTFAVGPDGGVTLISVAGPLAGPEGEGSAEGGFTNISIPASVTYDGTTYPVTAVGPYAFYLSGVTSVELPASIASVDDRAFRSSDVARVEVAADNPTIASFDGALYSADQLRLLLIPEGRAGAVLLPKQAEVVESSKFSHCSLVDAISVEEGGADFASWDGLLYDASGTTLLRVPAGATDVTIRDGCTTIAAGALEGCAKLERINAPATVTSISPDLFTSIPTVSLPAASVSGSSQQVTDSQDSDDSRVAPMLASGQAETQPSSQDEASSGVASSLLDQANDSTDFIPQLTAMVALSTADDGISEVDPSTIEVTLLDSADAAAWEQAGFSIAASGVEEVPIVSGQQASAYAATAVTVHNLNTVKVWCHVGYSGYNWDCGPAIEQYSIPASSSKVFTCATPMIFGSYAPGCTFPYCMTINTADPGGGYFWTANVFASGGTVNADEVSRLYRDTGPRTVESTTGDFTVGGIAVAYLHTTHQAVKDVTVTWDANGGTCDTASTTVKALTATASPIPVRPGYRFLGWYVADGFPFAGQKACDPGQETGPIPADRTFVAQWKPCEIGFDTDSEPDDADYPGEAKDPISAPDAVGPDGTIEIEDPKRPGYVFEGWVIPSADGTEAVDQDLVYQGDDGKWYVDASKLPDYAGDDGRVELTARWTSVISVDVPSSVTFYADLVTQGQQSREGAASSAFGQSKVANQSQVDLRVVGLESSAVKTTDTTLGADSILKKASAATPSTSTQKLFSLYPSAKAWTAEELQDPDAVGGDKAATAVDFDLDDILLEKSFKADDFTIAAGGTLNMGYRLNLSETGQQLDYDKLSTLSEGQSASIANVSYTFAADYGMSFWTLDDDGSTLNVFAIKADAEKIAAGDAAIAAKYTAWMNADHRFYVKWYDQGVAETDDPTKATVYDVRIIGLNHDDKSDGSGKAGITFQLVECLKDPYAFEAGALQTWSQAAIRLAMNDANGAIWKQAPHNLKSAISSVRKASYDGGARNTTTDSLFLPELSEVITPGTHWPNGGAVGSGLNGWPELGAFHTVAPQYELFRNAGISGLSATAANQQFLKKALGGVTSCNWWLRSIGVMNSGAKYVASVSESSIPNSSGSADGLNGVSFCFCL